MPNSDIIRAKAANHACHAGIVVHGSKKFMRNVSNNGWTIFNDS